MVIGADQLLVCNGAWFDKPSDRDAARAQLCALRGRTHTLITALVCQRGGQEICGTCAAPLAHAPFSDAFLDFYLDAEGDTVLSSVGAYRLEGLGIQLFDEVAGEHAAVLGCPCCRCSGFCASMGF